MRRLLLLLVLVPTAVAQDAPCSTEADPCPEVMAVDEEGIVEDGLQVTQGDWVQFTFYNLDEVEHVLFLDGYGRDWTLPASGDVEAAPFQFHTAGNFTLTDDLTGDTATIEVLQDDTAAPPGGEDKGIPAALPLAALGAALVARRR